MKTIADKEYDAFIPTKVILETEFQAEEDIFVTLAESLDIGDLDAVADLYGSDAAEVLLQLVEEIGFAIMDAEDAA